MTDPDGLWDDETDDALPRGLTASRDEEATLLDVPARSGSEPKPYAELEMDGATDRAPPADRFGRFLLLEAIGQGGMAEVRRALELRPDGRRRPCVVKRLLPGRRHDPEFRAMLTEEARTCRRLSHPNIVATYDAGEIDDTPYIAFELIEGPSLKDALREWGAAPVGVALRVSIDIARALEHAHGLANEAGESLGLIHRDISPENVLLAPHCAKLADFGIAMHEEREFETRTGIVKGKLGYMAPEIFEEGLLDARTDLFSLGLVLAELLAGQPVVPTNLIGVLAVDDLDGVLRRALSGRQLPGELVELVRQLCAWRSAERPASASVLLQTLRGLEQSWPAASIQGAWAASASKNPFELPTLKTQSSEVLLQPPALPGAFDLEDETEMGLGTAPNRRSR